MDSKTITGWIAGIIGFVVLFLVIAGLMPSLQVAGDNISNGNYFGALSSLFGSSGVVFVIIGAALIISVIYYFMHKMHK